jgi:hypothetical protein
MRRNRLELRATKEPLVEVLLLRLIFHDQDRVQSALPERGYRVVQILRQDGSVEKTQAINRGDTITTAVSAADLTAGTNWTIRLLNPEKRELKGITYLANPNSPSGTCVQPSMG